MAKHFSRADTALHRSAHKADHAVRREGRLAHHVTVAVCRPLRALAALIAEVERAGCGVNRVTLLQAKSARDNAWPYLEDETGEVWR